MRHQLIASLVPLVLVASTRAAHAEPVPSDLALIESSPQSVVFRYTSNALSTSEGTHSDAPVFPGTAIRRDGGFPPIPGRVVYVAIPPDCESVHAQLIDYSAPVTGAYAGLAFDDPSALDAVGGVYPADRLVVDGLFWIRHQHVARLILHPVLITSADGEVSHVASMTVNVTFDRPGSVGPIAMVPIHSGPFDAILDRLVINPEQARRWRSADNVPLRKAAVAPNPFAGANRWVAIRTRTDGPVVVTAADLSSAGVDRGTVDPRAFRLFAGPGRQVSTTMADPEPPLREVGISISGADDGRFDFGDELVFWSEGLNRWELDEAGNPTDIVNRYGRDNVYWLAFDSDFAGQPLRIERRPSQNSAPNPIELFSATARVRYEEDRIFRNTSFGTVASYYSLYWRNQRSAELLVGRAAYAEPNQPARFEIRSWAGREGVDPARLLVDNIFMPPALTGTDPTEEGCHVSVIDVPSFDPGAEHILDFAPDTLPGTPDFLLDHYSITFERRLDLADGPFRCAPPPGSQLTRIVLANAVAPELWDITDPATPIAIELPLINGTLALFTLDLTSPQRRLLYATESALRGRPVALTMVEPPDLHSPGTAVDYVIIGPQSLQTSMNDFVSYRAMRDGLSVRYVAIEDVYNSFALGLIDPVAVRRFLRHTYVHWPQPVPAYALLVGDGTYDFLNRTGLGGINYVPPYITAEGSAISDDRYVYFSDDPILDSDGDGADPIMPDMLIGRWPVRNAQEVAVITDKVRRYESSENLGPWRSRVVVLADDEYSERPQDVIDLELTIAAERVADNSIPPRLDINKIYMVEFPFNNPDCFDPGAQGCTKPSAREAAVASLNAGALLFNYVGHGNRNILAHEGVFRRAEDLPRLTNRDTPTAVLTFSCDIGYFDDPAEEGMSEEWLRMSGGGAVAVVSATRSSFLAQNTELNEEVFDLLFNQRLTGIAAALLTAKLKRQYSTSNCSAARCSTAPPRACDIDRGYILFGDPAMQIGAPDNRVVFTRIEPDSLTALTLATVAGIITDPDSVLLTDFDGELFVTVRDVPRQRTYAIASGALTANYDLAGGTLYRGTIPVTDGQFDFSFILPKDVAYGQTGARILGHAVSAPRMANGASRELTVAATAQPVTDTAGPTIMVFNDGGEPIADGFRLPVGTGLSIVIADSSGINLTGSPGHRIEFGFAEGANTPIDLTEAFAYDPGSRVTGRVVHRLEDVSEGPAGFVVKAWDNANNSTIWTAQVDITSETAALEFSITEFMSYPNPFEDETTFYFRATRAVTRATIRVFTLAGRKIWEMRDARDGEAVWRGTDQQGNAVGNGVYLAQIEARGAVVSDGGSVDKTTYKETKLVVSR